MGFFAAREYDLGDVFGNSEARGGNFGPVGVVFRLDPLLIDLDLAHLFVVLGQLHVASLARERKQFVLEFISLFFQ